MRRNGLKREGMGQKMTPNFTLRDLVVIRRALLFAMSSSVLPPTFKAKCNLLHFKLGLGLGHVKKGQG